MHVNLHLHSQGSAILFLITLHSGSLFFATTAQSIDCNSVRRFLYLCACCKSVTACRMSPSAARGRSARENPTGWLMASGTYHDQ